MIITITPNPAVDQTVFLDRLAVGSVNRFRRSYLDPAGKGINVSRIVRRLGWPTIAFGFLAGEVGLIARKTLDKEHVQHQFVPVPGQTRLNLTVVQESDWSSTSLFGPGPEIGEEPRRALEALVEHWLLPGSILVLAGRLPPGVPADFYCGYLRRARERGVRTVLDAEGEPLRLGLPERPWIVKPNVAEAEGLLDRRLEDEGGVLEGAREIARRGAEIAVISMGARGAVCVQGDRAWRVTPPAVPRRSTVGSGDSFVAGLAVSLARGRDLPGALRVAAAAGAATARTPGTAMGATEDVEALVPQVAVEPVEVTSRPAAGPR